MEDRKKDRLLKAIAFLVRNTAESYSFDPDFIRRIVNGQLRNLQNAGLITPEEANEIREMSRKRASEILEEGGERRKIDV